MFEGLSAYFGQEFPAPPPVSSEPVMDFDMLIFEDNLGTVWMPPAIPVHDPRQQLPPQRQPAYGDPREYQRPPAFDYDSEPQ
ncbi:hypothetical protein JTE90_016955 [Oedothorax gibbosus]|uniref:Uncharacterized protein n=1 Tax=Oedothorax gibbosus TaxID=931172 RepID=A0AAV6TMY4_9ARAC|nr:hypothetical protein JTE90_016955 [Oedothorax gibbosus]